MSGSAVERGGTGSRARSDHPQRTWVPRALGSGLAVGLAARVPVPLALARPFLRQNNNQENRTGSWSRLRDPSEGARYAAVRAMTERYAADGFVLDVGCSQGLLQEGLRYARYVGVDAYPDAVTAAGVRADRATSFCCADADSFEPDRPPDAVVFNEVLYYLPRPLATVHRYAQLLARDGVLIVSLFARTWATRHLLRELSAAYYVAEQQVVAGPDHTAWTVTALRRGDRDG